MNEAAAQLCLQMPTLLTRRDELFPLARQVVRESGYQYSKGHSRSQFSQTGFPSKLFGTNVNIAGGGTPSGREEGDSASATAAADSGGPVNKQARKRQRISDNDFLQQKRRVCDTFSDPIFPFVYVP